MNKLLLLLLTLFILSESGFGQIREYKQTEKIFHKQLLHEKTAKFPFKSFYQRKSDWQYIIDSTWGHGVSTSQKLQLFNKYADLIQTKFTLFYRLNYDWDSLRTFYSSQITDSTSQGGLFQIMSHMAWELKDGHSAAWNIDIVNAPLNPGTPLFIIPCWAIRDVSHFGASLTVDNEGEIFVFRSIKNHPLGLEPGDVIIGYEGVKWMNIVEELMNARIPIYGASSTNEKARNHDLLTSAGMNWHMFNTIDIVKYSFGDTLHL
jgi:hypothetical protein